MAASVTCIVAVRDGSRVCMAADSQATNNGSIITLHESEGKIVRRDGVLYGAGSGVLINLLRHGPPPPAFPPAGSLVPRPPAGPLMPWVVVALVPWLRAQLREAGMMVANEGKGLFEFRMLVARGAEFADVDNHGYAVVPAHPYSACGAGWLEASGAMCLATRWESLGGGAAERIARAGVEAAIELDSTCGPPVVMEWTEPS